jgi:hypothetical protein
MVHDLEGVLALVRAAAERLDVPPLRLCAILRAGGSEPLIVPRDYVGQLEDIDGYPLSDALRELFAATAGGADDALKVVYVEGRAAIHVVNVRAALLYGETVRPSVEPTEPPADSRVTPVTLQLTANGR